MNKFIVDQSFWNLFPEGKIGVVLLDEMDNQGESTEEIKEILLQSNEKAKQYLVEEKFSENPVIQLWRKAYQKFKTKKGVRSSIEALLKRVESGNSVSSINPLVDLYNAVSLTYGLPCGAEDRDSIVGNLVLGITAGGDDFYLIGDSEPSPTLEGELCYKDEKGAVCRCFNWRDGERTMITKGTKKAFLVMETIEKEQEKSLLEALETLKEYGEKYLKAKAQIFLLDSEHPEIEG